MGTKTYYMLMGLNTVTRLKDISIPERIMTLNNWKATKNSFTYLSPADGREMSSAFS